MPIELPNLDDRRYDDLVDEALALIPSLAPDWTNHNPSDPGITLVELFAWLSEMLIYRLDRVTDDNVTAFLRLINGAGWKRNPAIPLAEEVRATVLAQRLPRRAVTPRDFETLARASHPGVARAVSVSRRDLSVSRTADAPAHISVVVVPAAGPFSTATKPAAGTGMAGAATSASAPRPTPALLASVLGALNGARLLTTRVHVAAPQYLQIRIVLRLWAEDDAVAGMVLDNARAALLKQFDPRVGGASGRGWEFGRAVYVSEIYALLDGLDGVDYAENSDAAEVTTPGVTGREIKGPDGSLAGIRLEADELVELTAGNVQLTIAQRD